MEIAISENMRKVPSMVVIKCRFEATTAAACKVADDRKGIYLVEEAQHRGAYKRLCDIRRRF